MFMFRATVKDFPSPDRVPVSPSATLPDASNPHYQPIERKGAVLTVCIETGGSTRCSHTTIMRQKNEEQVDIFLLIKNKQTNKNQPQTQSVES